MKKIRNTILVIIISILILFPMIPKDAYKRAEHDNLVVYQDIFLPTSTIEGSEIYHEEEKETSFLFFGDIMTGRNVEVLSKENNEYPFLNLKDLLNEKVDIKVGNLEGPIDKKHIMTRSGSVSFSLPSYTAEILKNNGFNVLQLANNHMQDRGSYGFANTLDVLKNNDINYFGDYYNRDEFLSLEKNINGINYVFIGINMINTECEKDSDVCIDDIDNKVKNIIKDKENSFKIIFIHWGNEYILTSNNIQKTLAHKLIDSGIDLIIGGHPHVTQEIERYNNKMIFYSLGNFVFDQYFSKDTQQGYSIKLKITSKESKIDKLEFDLIPLQSIKSQSQIMDSEGENDFIKVLSGNSSENIKEEVKNKKIIIQ